MRHQAENPVPADTTLTTLAAYRALPPLAARTVTMEGSRAVRYRTAVVIPPSRYEVILVSTYARCRLRGLYRTLVTNI